MIEPLVNAVFFFFVYAFLGWGVEVAYAAVTTRQLVNRGFLNGPWCPIYGCGMMVLVGAMRCLPRPADAAQPHWLVVFVVGMVITTAIELVGGWALFKIFHTRWWDYSEFRWNLGGYICPQFSVLWGLGSVGMVKLVHPFLSGLARPLPLVFMLVTDGVMLAVFAVDLAVSAAAAVGLDRQLEEIDEMRAALRRTSDALTEIIGTHAMTADTLLDEQKLQMTLAAMEGRDELREQIDEVQSRANALRTRMEAMQRQRFGTGRLLRAFPNMKSVHHGESVAALRRHSERLRQRAREAAGAARERAEQFRKENQK